MPITSKKITAFTKKVADLPDKTAGAYTAAQAKAQFDAAPEELRVAHNALIDDLGAMTIGDSGAHNIGSAAITGVAGTTVHAQLTDMKSQLNSAAVSSLPDGSVTESKLASTVVAKFVPYTGITTNAGNAYSIAYPIAVLSIGFGISVQINVSSTGAATLNVDGKGAKPIKKPNGLDATNLVGGSIYTLRYNGTNFILQGEGGEYGTAVAADVLAPKTIGTENGLVTGTMVDRGNMSFTPGASSIAIPAGKHGGSGVVNAVAGLDASKITQGHVIAGVTGTNTNVPVAQGSFTVPANTPTVLSGLPFRPQYVWVGGSVQGTLIMEDLWSATQYYAYVGSTQSVIGTRSEPNGTFIKNDGFQIGNLDTVGSRTITWICRG